MRNRIGFLTSELKLEDFFTPNYLFDFFSSLHHVPEDIAQQRKKELFEKFGIDKFAEVKVANLSTGMKQKYLWPSRLFMIQVLSFLMSRQMG